MQDKDMLDEGRWPAPGAVSSDKFDAKAINRKVSRPFIFVCTHLAGSSPQ